jgi:hypothetical protein
MESSSAENKPASRRQRKAKSICLPFDHEAAYPTCMSDPTRYRAYIMEQYAQHPELFPEGIEEGFSFHDVILSSKQNLRMRRIKLKRNEEVYQLRPSFVMPYMIGRTQEVEKALYYRRWGVPFDALAYGFGRNPMYWYRAYVSLGRLSLVGTTIKDPDRLPAHVLADEKHSRRRGNKTYIPTTVAQECILGAQVVESAGEEDLKKGYQVFRDEAQALQADYTPDTVNVDGWTPTHNVWKALFPLITILWCFLHFVLKIKNRCRSDKDLLSQLQDRIWPLYHAENRASFAQRVRRLREWVTPKQMAATVKEKVLDLCAHAADFKKAYAHPGAYRTSNALDRLMDYQDRLLYTMRYFHGTQESASLYVRAMALVWNFHPYGQKTQNKYGPRASPFERLNGFRYHDNWLENMMIAASLGGRRE